MCIRDRSSPVLVHCVLELHLRALDLERSILGLVLRVLGLHLQAVSGLALVQDLDRRKSLPQGLLNSTEAVLELLLVLERLLQAAWGLALVQDLDRRKSQLWSLLASSLLPG